MAPTIWFENSHFNKLRSSLQVACSTQPALHFQPLFQQNTWASDPFVLFHNGIRHQIIDILTILRIAAVRVDSLQIAHCLALRKWILEFNHMVALYFLIRERVILPELKVVKPAISSSATLLAQTDSLLETMAKIHETSLKLELATRRQMKARADCASDEMYESLRRVSELVCSFVADCENMFSWEHDTFVPVMEELNSFVPVIEKMTKSWVRDLLQRCFEELLSFEQGEHIFRGYAANLPTYVREHCLTGVDGFRLRRLRSSERKWSKNRKRFRKRFASTKTA